MRGHDSELLSPVLSFEEESRAFYCADDMVGFGWVCQPLAGGDAKVLSKLKVLLNEDWPPGSSLQFLLLANPNLVRELASARDARAVGPMALRGSYESQLEWLGGHVDEPFRSIRGAYLRDFQLIICAKVPCEGRPPDREELNGLADFRRRITEGFRTLGLAPVTMSADDWVTVMSVMLNREEHAGWRNFGHVPAEDDRLLNQQILDWNISLGVTPRGISIGDKALNFLSVKTWPERMTFGLAAYLTHDLLSGARGLQGPFFLSGAVQFPDAPKTKTSLLTKRQWSVNAAGGPMTKWVPSLRDRAADFDLMMESIDNGNRPLKFTLTVGLYSENAAEAASNVSKAVNYWAELGLNLMPDRFINLPLLINSLPFGVDSRMVVDLGRYRTMTAEHASFFLPVFSDWKGSGSPAVQLVSRSGQLVQWCMFDSGTNFNTVIAAQSGSGKSFLANYLIRSYLSMGARFWVIDIGKSYRNLCANLDGEYVDFDENEESLLGLNPFPVVENFDEDSDLLQGLIEAMVSQDQVPDDFQKAKISKVLGAVWKEHGKESTIDLLAEAFEEQEDQRAKDLGVQLYNFTSKGRFGRYFNGANTVEFKSDFTVLELEWLRTQPQLQKIVLFILIYKIQQEMYLGVRDRKKIVLIDEAWDLLASGEVANFIAHAFRRFRKYGGAAVVITQSVADLFGSKAGAAIMENSSNQLLLGQKADAVDRLVQEKKVVLSDFELELLKSVQTVPGAFSEIIIRCDSGSGLARLVVSPEDVLLFSTKAEDTHAIDRYRNEGLNVGDAIKAVIDERSNVLVAAE